MRSHRGRIAMGVGVCALFVGTVWFGSGLSEASPQVTTLTIQPTAAYSPQAPAGATDDYHCTLIDPHVTTDRFIVSSLFKPASTEIHHEITYLVPPRLAGVARSADNHGKGWSCFGASALEGVPGTTMDAHTPWLTSWAPGRGLDAEPSGTGVRLPAGSLLILEVHYNLLAGDHPVRPELELNTVSTSTPLRPISLQEIAAPPDIPCPPGTTGALCSRAAELTSLGQRFGQDSVDYVDKLEQICHRDPSNPPSGDSTTCTWPINDKAEIVRLGVHMHLLGQSMRFVLDPGTARQRTLLDVSAYDFHDQRAYNLRKPVVVGPADTVQITCTYDPAVEQEDPTLRKVPPHYVTWGDGSTDEMCLGLVMTVPTTVAS
jgi:hypothetical protein